MKIKSVLALIVLLLFSQSIVVKAESNDYTIDGYIITYGGVNYDLSTEEGNYNLTKSNPNMTAAEYAEILSKINFDLGVNTVSMKENVTPNAVVPTDPGGGGVTYEYFNTVFWTYRSDGWNLSLNPKTITRTNTSANTLGWNELVDVQSSSSLWYNAESLKGQYVCHYIFASSKTYWNISPAIPNKSAFQWVIDRCN